jgi:Spy/CpxP family protein refolding chaperone
MKSTKALGRLAATFATLLLLATPASAQGFKWWMSDQYKHELNLTPDQSRRIEETFQAALPTLRAQKTALDDAEKQFQQVMERGNYSSVMEQVDHLEAARANLNRTRTMMLVNMRKLLTTDQWIKLDAMHQAAEQRKADAAHNNK